MKDKNKTKEQLIREVKTMRQRVSELEKAADAANSAKSSFLANMSHELRTPLNSIFGFSQLLEMESDNLSKDQLQFVGHIKSSCDHLLEMINDILDISKIEAGEMEVVKKPFDLRHMLRRVPLMAKYPADKKKIQIEMKIDPDLGLIEADEVRIKQVLYNLLSNAIKFTDPGKRIGMNARKDEFQIIIEVWDEGIGITGKDLEKIFDPFKQVSHAGSGRPEGAGLGLAISKRIIELHGGSLSVESK
ncbi:MAG TPA: HAMP domain-containing histidine kinase, partial [Spirochaetes bacterium]|nr:HAMP domain-containing histidine kinase [Spirochaetota bacterium]